MIWFPLCQLIANMSLATKARRGFSSLTYKMVEWLQLPAQGLDHRAHLSAMLDLNIQHKATSAFVDLLFSSVKWAQKYVVPVQFKKLMLLMLFSIYKQFILVPLGRLVILMNLDQSKAVCVLCVPKANTCFRSLDL